MDRRIPELDRSALTGGRTGGVDSGVRLAGALHPVSALAGRGPTGDLDGAMGFLEWLSEAGVTLWQVLPLCPPDEEGSPYSSWSSFSGDPTFVGLDWLFRCGLLVSSVELETTPRVDHEMAQSEKLGIVLTAAQSLLTQQEHPLHAALDEFITDVTWAREAARFRAIRTHRSGAKWWHWPQQLRDRHPDAMRSVDVEFAAEIRLWQAALFLFECQWSEIRAHARSLGVRIIGDMPIYVARDSVDVWAHRSLFDLDADGIPNDVAGAPPDAYSETGQLWGNPLFDWDAMAEDGYRWWVERVSRSLEHADVIRIDHFIGFSRYWRIPVASLDARDGVWAEGPGRLVFDALQAELGELPLIAEDLGEVDQATHELRDHLGLPGMRVIQFGLDGNPANWHAPAQYPVLCVACTGTHDSPTIIGWWEALSSKEQADLGLGQTSAVAAARLIDQVLKSQACWAIIPLADILGLDDEGRINRPGTSVGNWRWRECEGARTPSLARAWRERLAASDRLITVDES